VTPRAAPQRRLSIEEIEAAALDGPVPAGDTSLDIAPETLPVNTVQVPLPGAIEPNVQAVLDEQVEPAIPDFTEAADVDLPPVVPAGYDFSQVTPRTSEPLVPTSEAQPAPGAGYDFSSVVPMATPAPADPEAKPLNLSFGGQEGAIARAAMGPPKPVTTPEAADGSDVTFTKDGPAFQFTGTLVMDPSSGPEQGLDGMVPVAPRGPVAATAAAGQAEPVLNRRPRLIASEGGQIVFDQSSPERFAAGVDQAFAAGILPEANYRKIKAQESQIFKLVEERRKLEEKAQADPRLLAVLQGAGRGGAMTAGAVGGAKLGAFAGGAAATATGVGAPLAPVAAAVGGVAGAVGGGIGAGLAYDTLYKALGKHFEQYDNVMKAAELYPMHKAGGEMGMAALALPVSVAQGARGLMTTAAAAREAGQAVAPAVARQAATAAGAGGATGVVAYPIDALARGEEVTPGGFVAAAALGVATSGFFINNKAATQKDLLAVAAKMKAGTPLTAAESELARVAAPAMRAAFAEMDAAGGVRMRPGYDADGQFRMNDPEFRAQTTSVAGFMPRVAGAQARVPFSVPARLPEGALRAARAAAAARAEAGVPAGQTLPLAAPAASGVIRTAPVNVLPSGTTPIVIPPPRSPAMLSPDEYAMTMGAERGLDMDFNPEATDALYAEHFELVKAAVDRNEPVSASALDLYEIRVPYYVQDGETGVARFDEPAYRQYEAYMVGQRQDFRQEMAAAGAEELLAAVIDLGGLPAPKSGSKRAVWTGELKALYEEAKGAGKGKGGDNQKGVFINKLFRRDGMDLDEMTMALRQKGFRVETEADLIEMLGTRLRSGNEIFGLPTQSMEDVPMAMRGKAQQLDLLGEGDVEFGLVGQTDARSLTPQELAAQAAAEAAVEEAAKGQGELFGVQTDPLTPPQAATAGAATGAVLRGSGPQVLPGTAAPRPGVARTTTTPRPDWVLQPGETGEGRRLIKGIENYKRGQKWGMRQIIDLVNRAVKLEMRASRSQTTRKHPANYRPANHVAFTRNTQSQINFHEAGHGLYELMEARVPGFWKRYEAELMPLVDREGSMASANNLHEATAEWLRLLMVDPPAVANMAVTAVLAEAAEQFYPRMAATLRDGARAVHRFQNKPAAVKWAMLNADPQQTPPSWGDFLTAALRSGTAATNFLSSGAPVFKLDRGIFRAIMADRKEVDLGWQNALKLAREIRKETAALQAAYNMVLSIGAETTAAMSGAGPMRGVRVMGPDGKYKQLTRESYRDLRLKVPAAKLRQFDEAAWAKESLSRYEYFTERAIAARDAGDTAAMRVAMQQRQYPGMLEGLTTKDLAEIVSAARLDIPRFEEYFREQSAWFDAVLNVKDFGGLKKPGEVKAMMGARDTYWPLPKVMSAPRAARGRSSRGDIMAGDRRIQGSGEPIRAVDEVALERVRQAYDAYYWNRFGTTMVDRMQKVAADKRLPAEARIMAGQAAVRLTVPSEKVATLSAEEIVPWVLDAVATMMEGTLGFKPDLSPDDVRLSFNFKDVFRPGRPDDINVISLLRNGEREFYQLGDPGMFAMFASPQNASRTTALLRWALGPSLQNWKRVITQSLPFAFQNLFGDIFNQTMLNPEKVGWFPGGATVLGMMNKFSQKYPQVFQDGLLLSRVEPSATELLQQVRHNAVWQWMTEGFYVSTSKNPVTRVVQTALQPSNYLFPLWKLGDLINLITGGRALAPIFETATREGAAVYKLMKGATDEEALAAYWQVSGRFNEHAGNADVRALMQMPGFFNPMVQAFRGGMQNLTDPDPAVSGKTWVKLLTMYPSIFGGAAITTYLLMSEDEKARERERALEDRLSYYTVGGMRIRFPYGPEGAMGSMVYNSIMDDLLGRPKTEATRGATMLLKRIIDPGGGPLQFFGPQLATITEANMNWSTFRQKHIVAPWMTAMPASEQYYSTTPEFYKKLGEMMNYSPIKLQYVVQQAISRQADETIRLVEAIDRGRPLMEDADIPFVGRMFIRNPTGMASQSVKDVTNVGERLRLLDSRLASKGWSMLRDPNFDTEKIADRKLVQLQTQLQYLELLRYGVNQMSKISEVGKVYRLQEDYANEANARTMMMRYAQSLLAGNTDQIATIDQALELLQEIPKAPPEQVAADYLQRRN
jgi:hypothetical protein